MPRCGLVLGISGVYAAEILSHGEDKNRVKQKSRISTDEIPFVPRLVV